MTDLEARYRALVENSLDGVLYTTADGRILEMNRAMRELLGYGPDEPLPSHLRQDALVDPQDDRVQALLRERERAGRVRGELRLRRRDGSLVPVELTSSTYRTPSGETRSMVVARDVSERVRAERALRESEERFGKAFLASPAPIALVRLRDGRLIDVNPAFSDTFGFERDEVVGATVGELGIAFDRHKARRILHALQERGGSSETEVRFRTRDGHVGHGVLAYERVELGGEPAVVVLMHDVTDRRRWEEDLRVARERLERAEAAALVMTLHVDMDGRIRKVPPRLCSLLGYREDELLAMSYRDVTHPDDVGKEDRYLPRLLAGEIASFEFEKRYLRKDGGHVWVALSVSLVRDENDEPLHFLTYARDISEERRIRRALRERARQQEAVAQFAESLGPDGDLQGLLDRASDVIADALGAEFVKILEVCGAGDGLLLRSGVGWRDVEPGRTVFASNDHTLAGITLRTDAPIVFPDLAADARFERIELLRQHGVRSGVSVVLRGDDGPYGVIGAFSRDRGAFDHDDANVLKSIAGLVAGAIRGRRLLDALAHRALHDDLTGLPNRAAFEERLETALRQADRAGERVGVLFLDLDRFKQVNDTLGHHAGDELLRTIPERIGGALRGGDVLARLAGDEFVLMLPRVHDPLEVREVAERILATFREPFALAGREIAVKATLGICLYPDDGRSAADLLRYADTAMYQGKIAGRDTYAFYATDMDAAGRARIEVESGLRRALQEGSLEVHYQPQVELSTGRIVSLEALLRWRHPERGLLAPRAFLDVAVQAGLIVPIGTWVLREVFRRMARWRGDGLTTARLAVNVAAQQLAVPGFPATVVRLLHEAGLEPAAVEIEVTEGAIAGDDRDAAAVLARLRAAGLRTTLDDFGAGRSSLAHLRRLSLDRIKIDRVFTATLGSPEEDDGGFVRAMIDLARSMDLEVLAEGIERQDQVRALLGLGCFAGQGSLFGCPMEADAVEGVLRTSPNSEAASRGGDD